MASNTVVTTVTIEVCEELKHKKSEDDESSGMKELSKDGSADKLKNEIIDENLSLLAGTYAFC